MSKNLSAIKKQQVSLRNRARNRQYKSAIKTFTNKYLLSLKTLNNNSSSTVLLNLSSVYKVIDKAVKRGVLHKNHAARKKSRLAQAIKKQAYKS